ncbi:MAG TPA: peptidylprolyl isomerase [Abditibacteriaceae bacterium]|jgi:parvulin-like peptidyl-prolyl isomerase
MKKSTPVFALLAVAAAFPMLASAPAAFADETAPDAGGVVLAQNTPGKKPAAPAANGVAAEVNGEKIMMADIERVVKAYRTREPSLATGSAEANAALDNIRQQHLDNLITQTLLAQEAKKQKIVPKKEDVDKAMASLQEGVSEADFKKFMAAEGKTVADVREIITDELAIRELTKRLTSDVVVSDAEVSKFYNENPEEFKMPASAKASHILLAFKENMTAGDRQKVRVKADEVMKQAKAKNADFSALAKKHSEDPGSKDNGGSLGEFYREQMVKEFADAVWNGAIGSIVGPVESQFGYHVIKIEERKAPATLPLARVKENVKAFLLKKKIQTRLEEQVKTLRAAATIKKYI